jgi:hypothetical protein
MIVRRTKAHVLVLVIPGTNPEAPGKSGNSLEHLDKVIGDAGPGVINLQSG